MADYLNTNYNNITEYPNTFKRQGAFPLEMYSVFATKAEALEYLSSNPLAYEGQVIAIREDNSINVYVIIVVNSIFELKSVGSVPEVDDVTIKIVDGKLTAVATDDINTTYTLSGKDVPEEGGFKIILTSSNEADPVQSIIVPDLDIDTILEQYYTKTEANEAIAAAIAAAPHLKREIVNSVDDIDLSKTDIIFMVSSGLEDDDNKYYEYIVIDGKAEKVGSWEVDLKAYATTDYVDSKFETKEVVAALDTRVDTAESDIVSLKEDKVDKVEGSRLMTEDEGTKLAGIVEGAEVNVVKSVDDVRFNLTESGELELKALGVADVTGLQTELDKKLTTTYYDVTNENGEVTQVPGTLLSPNDKEKLAALVIGDEGGVEISGKVNADNVEGLDIWINENRDTVSGLFSTTDEEKLDSLAPIKAVNSTEFTITEAGQLDLQAVAANKVEGLPTLITQVGNLDKIINGYTPDGGEPVESIFVTKVDFNTAVGDLNLLLANNKSLVERITDIEGKLEWQDMVEPTIG